MSDRQEVFCGLTRGESIRSIARGLGRAPSTINREIQRHGGAKRYRASVADATASQRAHRPKRCRLARTRLLWRAVARRVRKHWSPQQIAQRLVMTYPNDPAMLISHETIYRPLSVQARGALKRELIAHLRRGLGHRHPRAAARNKRGPGQLLGMVSIAERAPSVDTRAVPGHWEGDLLMGKRGTQIATLVERQFRF
ncbi:MAG: IS30 family transposase, partial [Gemmatimonadota bacterium]|nr:IS30 family transposase [Gemmatimonadota bacterium]